MTLPPYHYSVYDLWRIGGPLYTMRWLHAEGGVVTLRGGPGWGGQTIAVNQGDYVTYMDTGAGVVFVGVTTLERGGQGT